MGGEFVVGQRVGDYQVLSILGFRGMGKVYKVRNALSERVEAMKVLLPDLTAKFLKVFCLRRSVIRKTGRRKPRPVVVARSHRAR
jgi:serine/threonine protein kinase